MGKSVDDLLEAASRAGTRITVSVWPNGEWHTSAPDLDIGARGHPSEVLPLLLAGVRRHWVDREKRSRKELQHAGEAKERLAGFADFFDLEHD